MTDYLKYTITPAAREGMEKFMDLARAGGFSLQTDKVAT